MIQTEVLIEEAEAALAEAATWDAYAQPRAHGDAMFAALAKTIAALRAVEEQMTELHYDTREV